MNYLEILTARVIARGVFPRVVRVATIRRGSIAAAVRLRDRGRGWRVWRGLGGFARARDGAGREESRDGNELGQLHGECCRMEVWLRRVIELTDCRFIKKLALNEVEQNEEERDEQRGLENFLYSFVQVVPEAERAGERAAGRIMEELNTTGITPILQESICSSHSNP